MSIALFDAPPRVTINRPDLVGGSRVGLLLGLAMRSQEKAQPFAIVCLEDGSVSELDLWAFTIDYRYNAPSDRWTDTTEQEPDQEG